MPEQLQKIANQILEWWKKFNTKQKALLISIAATIILALVILAVIVSKPTMVTLIECASTAEAGQVKDILDNESVAYETSQDGLIFYVDERTRQRLQSFSGKILFLRRDLELMMSLKAVSVLQRQIRTNVISCI